MSKSYVIANFKMNKVDKEVKEYVESFLPLVKDSPSQIILSVPALYVKTACEMTRGSNVLIAGQNINENSFGAYTGEINAEMLSSVNANAVIVGHSERRNLFGESDNLVNKKILKALKSGLICIFCFGESLFDKKNQLTEQVLSKQLITALSSIYGNELGHIIFAYEPVWAIGTGVTPTTSEIANAIKLIRKIITNLYDEKIANEASIIYGGSLNEQNVKEIAKIDGLNGVLVGGACLNATNFANIVKNFDAVKKLKTK